jgi:hypothetical protein
MKYLKATKYLLMQSDRYNGQRAKGVVSYIPDEHAETNTANGVINRPHKLSIRQDVITGYKFSYIINAHAQTITDSGVINRLHKFEYPS